ncbi:MAG: methyltransferase domain-containing protein [Deltaproteobacteria bacterium]|nr:methyltransferase domain-containing protein [Deltaproteobacteria bacterium]
MEKKVWTPADLLQLSGDYWSACALHAGVKLDLFTHTAVRQFSATELAGRLEIDGRGLAMLLNALAALELLEKSGEAYAATPFAAEFLARTSPGYMGYIILHHHHLMASWAHLDEAVRQGGPIRERFSHGDDETVRESFEMGMFNLAMQAAPRIVPQIDLSGRRRLLDLGGGPGTYAVHFCRHNPQLTAVVYDLPSTRRFAEQTIARFGLSDRIGFEAGDFDSEEIRGSFDVAWLSHILHGEGPQGCAAILRKAVAALEPGGMILVQEFILNDSQDGPLFPALFSLNMLLGTPDGQAYSEGQLFAMLAAAGLGDLRRLPLELPNGAGVIAGSLPGRG